MNWQPSNYEIQNLANQMFARFDQDRSGTLSQSEIKNLLHYFGLSNEYYYNDFILFYDRQGNGILDKNDMLLFCKIVLMTDRLLKIYDNNCSQTLEGYEVQNMLKGVGIFGQKQFSDLLHYFDKDYSGQITKIQLHHFCKVKAMTDLAFQKYDTNRSGRISPQEVVPLLHKYKFFSQQDIQNFKTWDIDHDGSLNKAQFYRLMRKILTRR